MARGLSRRVRKSRFIQRETVCCSFPIQEQLMEYAWNMKDRVVLNDSMLSYLLSVMSLKSRKIFLEHFYCSEGEPIGKKLDRIHDPRQLAREMVNIIFYDTEASDTRKYKKFLYQLLGREIKKIDKVWKQAVSRQKQRFSTLFGLEDDDITIVFFLYCLSQSEELDNACSDFSLTDFLRFISISTGLTFTTVRKRLSKKSRIAQCGILTETRRAYRSSVRDFFELNDEIIEYLSGMELNKLEHKYFRKETGKTFDISTFTVSEKDTSIIQNILKSDAPSSLLLYGKAGAGKTEYAKSVAASCGKEIYFVQHGEDGDKYDRRAGIFAAVNSVDSKKGVIIIDEADSFLNTDVSIHIGKNTVEKGWLNNLLDTFESKLIWIVNHTRGMEQSVLRRFSYSLKFSKPTRKQRVRIWQNLVQQHRIKTAVSQNIIEDLAYRYEVTAGGIASALKVLKNSLRSGNITRRETGAYLEQVLEKHQEALTGIKPKKLAERTDKYDMDALNLDTDPYIPLKCVLRFLRKEGNGSTDDQNVNMLFWGPPGTGKTEFVKHIGRMCGADVIIKRASDLQSKWLGETEKNIAEAFDQAEREHSILFIDEADSFFIERRGASRPWEVSQTNEFLTQMENHKTVLICCTNFMDILDKASLRRFDLKIEFRPLSKDGKVLLYRRYFPSRRRLTPADEHQLRDIPGLTPGDMKTVARKIAFAERKNPPHETIIAELRKEALYRDDNHGKRLGFRRK